MAESAHPTRDRLGELAAFLLTVACAIAFRWKAGDLIWGLWASSLCIGYSYIVISVVAGVCQVKGVAKRLLFSCGGLFTLAFFTVHFGLFHLVHSVFLNHFFPLVSEHDQGFPNILVTLSAALHLYWPLVVSSFVARRDDFREAIARIDEREAGKADFIKPYANVVRMHLLIFVFAGLSAAHISRFAIYPVLIFYFFPLPALLGLFASAPAEKAGRRRKRLGNTGVNA